MILSMNKVRRSLVLNKMQVFERGLELMTVLSKGGFGFGIGLKRKEQRTFAEDKGGKVVHGLPISLD